MNKTGLCSECWTKIEFINKPYCKICGVGFELSLHEDSICLPCMESKDKSYYIARSLFYFSGESKKLIYLFKYYDNLHLARFFSNLLINNYQSDLNDIDIIVPVPMHIIKRIYRKYNPPQILGSFIANDLNKKQIPDMLRKKNWTKSQKTLSKKERSANLSGSIEFNKKYTEIVKDKILLLIDDVRTTQVTIAICSAILKQNGAKSVKVFTIAMTESMNK